MKRILLPLLFLITVAAVAQPPARRKTAAAEEAKKSEMPKAAAYRDFPTAQPMPQDAAWRRDIYRSLDLRKDENATLYFPTTPQGDRVNLFTYLFKLLLRGQITAYDYKLDGNEDFSQDNVVKARELMDRYHIFYEEKDGRVRVNDVDLPSDEVLAYYVKESTYYDQHTASLHSRITAICPVLKRGDTDFGGADTSNPMFWLKYDDIKHHLARLMLTGSNLNNAAMLSADDYFTMNLYKGDIYYVTNLQDRVLASYCPTDSALKKEQQRIEKELTDFRAHVWGHDSIALEAAAVSDSTQTAAVEEEKKPSRRTAAAKSTRRTSAAKATKTPKASAKRNRATVKQKVPSSGGGSAKFSVRRERH